MQITEAHIENLTDLKYEDVSESRELKILLTTKAALEIKLLEKQLAALEPPKEKLLKRFYDLLNKYLVWISSTIVLIIGIAKPFSEYIETKRKAQVVSINNDLLKIIFDAKTDLSKSQLVQLSIQPPDVLAPLLLYQLNTGKLDRNIVDTIYTRMYSINEGMPQRSSITQFLSSLFGTDNKQLLIENLCDYAKIAFEAELPDKNKENEKYRAQISIFVTYINIFQELNLREDKKVKKVLQILQAKCSSPGYEPICSYANLHQ